MSFLSWPYVEGISAWGEMTSATRFCEMNCYVSSYVVEFISTLTCAMYVYLGARGIQNTRKHGKDIVVIFGCAMLAFVGIGSVAYHSTIKYTGQMIDEASMLYATAAIFYGAFTVTMGELGRKSFAVILSIAIITISIIHYFTSIELVFRIFFGTMVFVVFLQCVWLLSTRVSDVAVVKDMKRLALYGAVAYVLGFVVWNLDTIYCAELQQFRDLVGMPLGFITELHGWWHVLTGLGVYYYVVFIEYLRLYLAKPKTRGQAAQLLVLIWPSPWSLPRIEVFHAKAK